MKIVIFTGSGHSNSASFKFGEFIENYIHDELDSNAEIVIRDAVDLDVHDCLGCDYCLSHQGQCVIQDDMEMIYKDLWEADKLIFVSAVYFSNIPSVLKRIIDRCQLFFNLKDRTGIPKKECLAVCHGGAPEYDGQFTAFKETFRVLFPDFNAQLLEFIGIPGSDKIDIVNDPQVLEQLRESVQKLIN